MRMWARGRIQLRLTEDEFWRMTPRKLQALYRAHEELISHQEYLTGIVASTTANFSMGGAKKAILPADFFNGTKWARKQKWQQMVGTEADIDSLRANLNSLVGPQHHGSQNQRP